MIKTMNKTFILSDGSLTKDLGIYIRDLIKLELNTPFASIPTTKYGFNKSVEGVDLDEIRVGLESQVTTMLNRIEKELNVKIEFQGAKIDSINSVTINIKIDTKSYEINL